MTDLYLENLPALVRYLDNLHFQKLDAALTKSYRKRWFHSFIYIFISLEDKCIHLIIQ